MKNVYYVNDNIISPLGLNTKENFENICSGKSGIKRHHNHLLSDQPFYAALMQPEFYTENKGLSHFETITTKALYHLIKESPIDLSHEDTLLILSTTKGNIELLPQDHAGNALLLHRTAQKLADYFGFKNTPKVVSNACISGLLAQIIALRLLNADLYQNVVVVGADVVSQFVLSGFMALRAIDPERCKPFDIKRHGMNLGVAAAAILLTNNQDFSQGCRLMAGHVSNDANHISAPSRTGEALADTIRKAMTSARLNIEDVDAVAVHGTGTLFNDAMEAKALELAGINTRPIFSLKGYYGHTLGASGVLETIILKESIESGILLPTLGFEQSGVDEPVNIIQAIEKKQLKNALKIMSGFGGSNAAIAIGNNH